MAGKGILLALVALLAAGLSACSVMQGTYQVKVDEADALAKQLAALQMKYEALSAENAALKGQIERLSSELAAVSAQRDKVSTDLAYVSGHRDKLAAEQEELKVILEARSDALYQSIAELQKKVDDLEAENRRLRPDRVPKE